MSVNEKSLANLELGRQGRGDRIRTQFKLYPWCRWLLQALGGKGGMVAGVEQIGEMVRLLGECYGYVPDNLAEQIEALGIFEVIAAAPDEYAMKNEEGEIVAWVI